MLTSKADPNTIELPHEPGEWILVRVLSGTHIQRAKAMASAEAAKKIREMGAGVVAEMQTGLSREAIEAVRATQTVDPLKGLDRRTMLHDGIIGWSYYEGKPTPADIDDLDEITMQYVAERLVPKSVSGETEADRKNGSSATTASSVVSLEE